MIRRGEAAFVDSGAWIGLAIRRDPHHDEALEQWEMLHRAAARLRTSVPVVLETFTFLDRNAHREVALAWKESLRRAERVAIMPCELGDLDSAWDYFRRSDLHKLSAVDATSFAMMKRLGISLAFTFDHHFAMVGFRHVG